MTSQGGLSGLTVAWAAVPILVIVAAVHPSRARNSAASYVFLVASGFLCEAGDAYTCPAVVKSAQGDSYEMSGAGMINPESKSITATGTFTHRSADGNARESGVWEESNQAYGRKAYLTRFLSHPPKAASRPDANTSA